MVFSLVYVSAADDHLTRDDLRRLVEQSRTTNAALDITGLLLYRSGGFLQLLEGDRLRVESLFRSIRDDARHHDVVLTRSREQPARQFPGWTMAYGDVDLRGTGPMAVETAPRGGPAAQTETEAALVRDLLDLFDS